jgi:light-regulated signal transduction histidine kinase (bacteriophytochrome)
VLCYWLQGKGIAGVFHQPSLPADFEEAQSYAGAASGLLALPIQADRGNFLLAFRPEAVHTVDWGGNPNEALRFEENSTAYHPRNSFALWQETVRSTAVPWTEVELAAADQLRNFLVEFTLKKLTR